jgi:TonB family protein
MRLLLAAALAATLCASPGTAWAADAETPGAAALEAVSALDVEAALEIDATGTVTALVIDTPLPAPMRANLEARVRQWKFAPVVVDGAAQQARGRLHVALSARKQDDGFAVLVDHASVGDVATAAGPLAPTPERVATRDVTPPRYPASVLRNAELSARVLLAVLVDAEGKVANVAVLQSTLFDATDVKRPTPQILAEFERAASKAARDWRFDVLPGDAAPTPAEMTMYLPVGFGTHGMAPGQAGAWRPQVRRPRIAVPWLEDSRPVGISDEPRRLYGANGLKPLALLDEVAGTRL